MKLCTKFRPYYFLSALVLVMQSAYAIDHEYSSTLRQRDYSANIMSFVPGNLENMRQPIIDDLVGAKMNKLNAPDFPRIWTERSKSEVIGSNTKLGAKVPLVDLGGKLSLDFRYSLRTSFVIVSSKVKALKKIQNRSFSKSRVMSESQQEDEEVLNFDDKTYLTYPNVRADYPMVGMCVFEASLGIEKTLEGGIDFIVGETARKATVETMSNAIFSNFFQLSADIPVDTYLNEICNGLFKKEVQPMVINDFSKMVMEKVIAQNPKSDCSPSSKSEDVENGDAACLNWHSKTFPANVRHLTVPRCLLQNNGIHRCRLRARKGTACRMYIDPATKKMSAHYQDLGNSILATEDYFAYSCDSKKSLSCELDKEPTLLHGIPIFAGRASCR